MIRRDVWGEGVDIHDVADKHGFRLVHTIYLDTGPLAAALIMSGAIHEHNAAAVIVPSFEHSDSVRYAITDLAALVTPMRVYPRGYRWPVVDLDRR